MQRDSYRIAHANKRIARLHHQFFTKLENPTSTKREGVIEKIILSNAMDGNIHYAYVVNYGQDVYELLKCTKDIIRIPTISDL